MATRTEGRAALGRVIRWSLDNRVVTLFAAGVVMIAGAYVALTMPVDVFPDLTAPTVTVLTDAHGMAPEEVETLVTFPIETAVNGSPGVRRVRSSSAQGISIVWVEFDWGTDVYRARQIVGEKLQTVAELLPEGVAQPALAPVASIMGEILLVGMSSARHDPMEVRGAADWVVRRRLLAIPGVAQVVPIGGAVRQYHVHVDPAALAAYEVGLEEVVESAAEASAVASGGVYHEGGQEVVIRAIGRANRAEEIGQTVVAVRQGAPVLLADVARIEEGAAPRFGTASVNAEPAVILSIQKQPDVNTIELTRRIDAELAALEEQLPEGMEIDRGIFRQADFIEHAVDNVVEALVLGAILVVVILFLFLWNVRTTAISLLAIPLSLAAAMIVLRIFGDTLNTMTLGGLAIAIGALVDDAIIDVENTFRRLRERLRLPEDRRPTTLDTVYRAAREVLAPMVSATLIIVIVFVPLFFLSGVEGRMLRPLGFAYIVSIMASLVVALTVTPVLCSYLLKPGVLRAERDEPSALVRWLKRSYDRTLTATLDRPRPILAGSAIAAGAALLVFLLLGRGFLPEFQEGTLTISAVTLPGSSIETTDMLGARIERILLDHPAVESTARRTGRAELDEHAQGTNASEIDVALDLEGRDFDRVVAELREDLAAVPGTNITIGQPIGHRIDHMLSGTRASIAVKVFGTDLYELRSLAEGIRAQMESVEGVVDLAVEQQADVPQLLIEADRAAMASLGVTPGELTEASDVLLAGEPVGRILEGQRSFDLVVRAEDEARSNAEQIRSILITTPGGLVPLDQLARVRLDRGPNEISREDVQRKIVVQANVEERDVGSVVAEIRGRVTEEVPMPEGYRVEYGGQFESGERAGKTIAILSLVSIAAIFLLLFQEFGSARNAALVMVNLPLALVGGLVAVFAAGGVLNVATMVGFITLFGIAVRNGILLVSHYNDLLDEGKTPREAVRQGSLERLNPILMTALCAGLALIPLALGGGEPGKEIQAPMALVVLGGLLSSTALNMVVVPALFLRYGEHWGRSGLRERAEARQS